MSKLAEFTEEDTHAKVYINPNHVISVRQSDRSGRCMIVCIEKQYYHVYGDADDAIRRLNETGL